MKSRHVSILILLIGLVLAALAMGVVAQNGRAPTTANAPTGSSLGTAFTYQGVLTDNGNPADGSYDLQFKLYDAASGGQQVGSTFSLNDEAINEAFLEQKDENVR